MEAQSIGESETTSDEVTTPTPARQRTAEEILKAREDRLKRLEDQCKGLFNKMNQTSQRSDQLSSRLVELHEHYGEEGRQRKQHDAAAACSSVTVNVGCTLARRLVSDQDVGTNLEELKSSAIVGDAEQEVIATVSTNGTTPNLDPDPKT